MAEVGELLSPVMTPPLAELDAFERAVLGKLLAGDDPVLAGLRRQAECARIRARELTGAGFYLSFAVSPDTPPVPVEDVWLGDVLADIEGLSHGAGFVVLVRAGRIELLEGYSYGEPWPAAICRFALRYEREPRDFATLLGASRRPAPR